MTATGNAGAAGAVRVERLFDASIERVFDAWLDPAVARAWLFATSHGRIVRAEIDPRVGGRFVFVDRRGDEEVEHVGEYLQIERPHRLVFTFGVPAFGPEVDVVTVELFEQDAACRLVLTHVMSAAMQAEWGERTREGWTTMLGTLDATLAAQAGPAVFHRHPGKQP